MKQWEQQTNIAMDRLLINSSSRLSNGRSRPAQATREDLPALNMKKIFSLFLFFLPFFSSAQNQNSVWIFGDSAGIDFSNLSNPIPKSSVMDGRGSCASVADSTGQLLFYAWTIANAAIPNTHVFNYQHQLINNGDGIVGEGWYNELIILPMPNSSGMYYLFSIGVTDPAFEGLYYSIIDMNANGGLGAVTTKNIQLLNLYALDAITVVKHGNGRDWWLIFKSDGYQNPPNNDFYIFLITPNGISSPSIQSLGYAIGTGGGSISFSNQGDKILMTDWRNLIQLFDFERCTGNLSNPIIIEPEHLNESGSHFGSCFSPDGSKIYVTRTLSGAAQQDSWLYQYDLTATNIAASRDTLYHAFDPEQGGEIRLAPDDKVYLSMGYYAYYFPFPDSMHYTGNMNLSVINQPDSLGAACQFSPYSFYLGGKRTYYGLPNNPDYEMGPLIGSGCDSLPVGLTPSPSPKEMGVLHLFYHGGWQVAFINAVGLQGKNYSLSVYDLMGHEVYKQEGLLVSPSGGAGYYTKDLNCAEFANGMYIVKLQTEKEVLSKKFVKE